MYLCFRNFKITKKHIPTIYSALKLMAQNFIYLVASSQSVSQNVVHKPAALESLGVTY